MSSDTATRVEYQLVEDDLRFVHQILSGGSSKSTPTLGRLLVAYGVVFPFFPFVFLIVDGRFLDRPVLLGYGLTVAVSLFGISRIWKAVRRNYVEWASQPESRRHLQRTTLTLFPEGIHQSAPLMESRFAWSLITKITASDNHEYVLLYLEPTVAFVIPARAFVDRHAMDSFVEEASNLQEQFTGGSLQCRKCGYDMRVNPDEGCPECGWMRKVDPQVPTGGM